MRNPIIAALLVATLGLSSTAMAASNAVVDGTIKALDAKACTVTLDNKTVYHFARHCNLAAFKVGEKVAITWHLYKKIDVGTKIVAWTAPAMTTPAKKH